MSQHRQRAIARNAAPIHGLAAVLSVAAACALMLAAPAPATAQPRAADLPVQARYDAARDEYEIGHFQLAFAEFAALADLGHCNSARIALQMVRYGKPLYASEFRVEPTRLERWQRLGACDREVAAAR